MPLSLATIRAAFLCHLIKDIMIDSVICTVGYSYDRWAIEEWLCSFPTSPNTNECLYNKYVISNKTLKSVIENWVIC
ncbi:MAG: U-box domain-containing protein [Flavobacterium sp.]